MNGRGGTAFFGALILFLAAIALCVRAEFASAAVRFASAALTALTALYCRRELSHMKARAAALEEAAEQRVRAEQDKAAEAREKILRYHSLISHGLRIPISIIMGYADILMGRMAPDAAARDEYIRKMCEKAAYMNDLLSYSLLELRYDKGSLSSLHKQFDLLSALRGVADAMCEPAARSGVDLQLVSEQDAIFVRGSATGLSKVFYNIVENALKYMGRPGSLNITAALPTEGEALIVFKDDGLGLPAEEAAHVFERNYQGENAHDGNGLGLWIAKAEVESHGGTIAVKSEAGKGLGVYITLPAAPAADAVCEAAQTPQRRIG
jgi:signal transduction histidine kinase